MTHDLQVTRRTALAAGTAALGAAMTQTASAAHKLAALNRRITTMTRE